MDYDNGPSGLPNGAKAGPGDMTGATEKQWQYLEPLLTPQQLRDRFLFGIPLMSGIKDPITRRSQVYTDELIKDTIERAVGMVEADTSICIFPQIIKENQAFDRNDYVSWGYFRTERRPIAGVHEISVITSVQKSCFITPLEWVETGRLKYGQVNLIPFTAALGGSGGLPQATSAGGAVMLQILANRDWIPSFWQITYTAGFPDALLPKLVNEIVGTKTAMEVLSQLGATYARTTSQSLGIDALSQSTSGPGPQIYVQRYNELEKKYDQLKHKIKAMFGMTLFSGQV